jgi:nucleotide-binding universal stress UspA family protein
MKANRIKRHLWQLNQARGLSNVSRPIRRWSNNREFAAAPKRLKAKKKIRSIIVPLDGSTFAEHAIPLALEFAKRSGASLQLVQVLSTLEFDGQFHSDHVHEWLINSLKRKKEQYLSDAVQRICSSSGVSTSTLVTTGREVSVTLAEEIDRLDADLVVMATRGRGAIGRFWRGSIAYSILERIKVPLVLVRGHQQPVNSKAKRIDHVVLALDGTESVERILSTMLVLDALSSAQHTLLRVLKLDRGSQIQAGRRRSVAVPSQSRISAAFRHMDPIVSSLRKHGRLAVPRVVHSDDKHGDVILTCAKTHGADLVVAAADRRSGIAKLFQRSIADWLFNRSSIPLMLVPTDC